MKIYKVTVKATGKEVYCSSLAAIFEVLTPEETGCKLISIWGRGFTSGKRSETRRLVIEQIEVHAKSQKNK